MRLVDADKIPKQVEYDFGTGITGYKDITVKEIIDSIPTEVDLLEYKDRLECDLKYIYLYLDDIQNILKRFEKNA